VSSAVLFSGDVVMLQGRIGHSTQWGSGWLDLTVVRDFKQGDKLRLKVGGSAKKIVVRLLSEDDSPDDPAGVDGGPIEVPQNGMVDKTLLENHSKVKQISVHGNENPWGQFPLGGGNGPATLLGAELVP